MAAGSCSGMDDVPLQRPLIAVSMKWVPLRKDMDPDTGVAIVDDRFAGASPADHAALEVALRHAARVDADVVVACVGPPAADAMLRAAVACGANRAIRIDPGRYEELPDSAEVAGALATLFGDLWGRTPKRLLLVCCGDWSLDRGSGSVPALLAHFLGVPHALGLVAVRWADDPNRLGVMECERRLDGGRREVLQVTGSAVVSMEGAVATLRRASLAGVIGARDSMIEVLSRPMRASGAGVTVVRTGSHRPMPQHTAHIATGNPRDRVSLVLGVGNERKPPMRVTLDPDAAAHLIHEHLLVWGQIPT